MDIVLVTNNTKKARETNIFKKDVKNYDHDQNTRMMRQLATNFFHYTSVKEFERNIKKHKDHVVVPLLDDKSDKKQKSILSSMCDYNEINYVGADSMTRALCNDRHLSKLYAEHFNIKTPASFLVSDFNYLDKNTFKALTLPLIIKQNCGEADSIEYKIVNNYDDALQYTSKLFEANKSSIFVEEYVEGNEVELIIVGNKNNLLLCEEVEVLTKGNVHHMQMNRNEESVNFSISHHMGQEDRDNILTMFKSFEIAGFMSVGGKILNGEFYLTSISPDCSLETNNAFHHALKSKGLSYADIFIEVIEDIQEEKKEMEIQGQGKSR